MQLTLKNVKPWVRAIGESVTGYCGPRTMRSAILHDYTYTCEDCEGVFTDREDMSDDDSGVCTECYGGRHEGMSDWDKRRQWGTY